MTCCASAAGGGGIGLGGISSLLSLLGQERPAGEVVGHHIHGGIGLEVELRGGHLAAMAGYAIFADKGPDGLLELLVEPGVGRGLRPGWLRPPWRPR